MTIESVPSILDFILAFFFAAIIIWGVMEIFGELIAYIICGAMQVLYYSMMVLYLVATFVWKKLCLVHYVWNKESKQNTLLAILAIGCLAASIGIGVNPTGHGIAYKLILALATISMIVIRIYENREFRNPDHDMELYQAMKRRDGIFGIGIGVTCFIVAALVTDSIEISFYTIPGLAVFLLSAGKIAKYNYIDFAGIKSLTRAIKVKYFFMDTSELVAKATEYKANQTNQRVAV